MARLSLLALPLLLCISASASATDLNLSVRSNGLNSIVVGPGDVVTYQVVGELSDSLSDGMAMFVFDLAFDGGSLQAAAAPMMPPMTNFARPAGIDNPAGFGGTPVQDLLAQVGGAQNTIKNQFAPFPTGSVITQVAQQGAPAVLVTGTLTAPLQYGTYTLSVVEPFANVIRQGQTGSPFWAVDAANAGAVTNLVIEVISLSEDVAAVSVATGGTVTLSLNAGAANAGRPYWLLGSLSGASPGLAIGGGLVLPLNVDAWLLYTIQIPNNATPYTQNRSSLDGLGHATATLTVPSGLGSGLVGLTISHAYVLEAPIDFTSNAVTVTLTP
ncbi:MAG: hypothetical protein HY812_06080 [Planctomycetes bacterium]|nr:hypothetical protein [Planctomycetota bacterium]